MSTVTDITGLVALESQAPAKVEAPAVGIPALDLSSKTPSAEPEPKAEKSPEAKTEAKVEEKKPEAKAEDSKAEAKALPDQKAIHETLKAFYAEATPEGKEKLQKLNSDIRDLYTAHKEALSASKDVSEVVTSAKELQELVQASDELVYSADPQIVSNIFDDIVATNGNAEAFDKLVPAFVDKLKETNPKAYYEQHVAPIYQHALESTGMVEAVRNLIKSYNAGDQAALRTGIEGIAKHLEDVGSKVEQHKVAAETAKAEKIATETRSQLEADMSLDSKKALGAALRPHLLNTELGTYPRETLVTLSRYILQDANAKLDSDRTFNALLQKLYKAGDIEGVKKAGREKIQSLAAEIVEGAIKRVYPNGLSKRSASASVSQGSYRDIPEGKALIVKAKPANLLRSEKNASLMEIRGCGYAVVNGKKQLVSWRKN